MQAIVKWDRNGKKGESEPMDILEANRIAAAGREGWGLVSHWTEPVLGDSDAGLLKRARRSAVTR